MRYGSLLLVIACRAAAPPTPSAPSNRVVAERPEPVSTTLQIYVQDVRRHCAQLSRDHVEVTIDGRSVGTIIVFCLAAGAHVRRFRLAADPVVVEGRHRIGVRHVETGRSTAKDLQFPAGRPDDPREPWIERDKLMVTFDHTTLAIGELSIF